MSFGKYATLYALVTQGLIGLLVLTGGGYLLGRVIDSKTEASHPLLPGFIAVFGAIIGLTNFIVIVLREGKKIEAIDAKKRAEAKAKKEEETNAKKTDE